MIDEAWAKAPRPQEVQRRKYVAAEGQDRFDQLMVIYDAVLDHMSKAVGNLVAGLKPRGVVDNFRIPFVAVWPGKLKSATISGAMVCWPDLLPIFFELGGSDVPGQLDEKSFAGVLRDTAATHRDRVFTTHSGDRDFNVYPIRSVLTREGKYIRNRHPEFQHQSHISRSSGPSGLVYWKTWLAAPEKDPTATGIVKRFTDRAAEELYDVAADPFEEHNFATDPKQLERLASTRTELDAWMRAQGDRKVVFGKPLMFERAGDFDYPRCPKEESRKSRCSGKSKNRCLAIVALLCAVGSPSLSGATQQPNILFILTEDQGAHLGAAGTAGLQTPNLDTLARSGVRFRNAFVAYPVCSPSKAAIYTSLHNHTNGILNNTPNYHKPADQLTAAEKNNVLYRTNRIGGDIPTLVERLKAAGYYQGVTHKLHVAPVEKFPYDEFMARTEGKAVRDFIERAAKTGKPWHLFYNIPNSHRPFPNSDKVTIRVQPDGVNLPAFLPDTAAVRQDWAEYLAGIEAADHFVGEVLEALRASGQESNTIVVCLAGDHGPAFPHGKMTLYDLGLRVNLIIRAPGMKPGGLSDALVSELDLTPTLLDLLGLAPLVNSHGVSLRPLLEGKPGVKVHDFIFAEISDRGVLPNNGMQERSVCDGRWHLIYREKLTPAWRQVQADSKDLKPWGNRTYTETVRVKEQFPEPFRILAEMDPQNLGGKVPRLEIYDLKNDPDEMTNLASAPANREERNRLYAALRQWVRDTADTSVQPPPAPPE